MKILETLQFSHEFSCTYCVIERLTKWRPLRYHSFGPTSPYSNLEKIISLALKILIVPPLLAICSALDLVVHITIIPWFICCDKGTRIDWSLKGYFLLFISIVVRPIFAAAASLAGKSPEFVSSANMAMQHQFGGPRICDYNQLHQRLYDNTNLSTKEITDNILPLMENTNIPSDINCEVIRKLMIKNKSDIKLVSLKDKNLNKIDNSLNKIDNNEQNISLKLSKIDNNLNKIDSDIDDNDDQSMSLKSSTSPENCPDDDQGVLSFLIKNGPDEIDQEIINYLIKKEINLNPENCILFPTIAIVHGKFKLAKQLIKAGCVFHLKDFEQFETFINNTKPRYKNIKEIHIFVAIVMTCNDLKCKKSQRYLKNYYGEIASNYKSNSYLKYLSNLKTNSYNLSRNSMYFNIEFLQKKLATEKKKLQKERIKAKGEVYLRIFDRHVDSKLPKEIWHKIAEFI